MTTRAEMIAKEIAAAYFAFEPISEEDVTKEMLAAVWGCQVDTAGKRADKLVARGVLTRHHVIGPNDRPIFVYRKKGS